MLAAIIERVTGKSYETYLEQEIFRPAGVRIGYIEPHWEKRELACGMKNGHRWGNVTDYFAKKEPSWSEARPPQQRLFDRTTSAEKAKPAGR